MLQGMHQQLAALKKLVETVDPGLAEYLEDRGHSNYYFTFRWLLVQFKREVSFDEVCVPLGLSIQLPWLHVFDDDAVGSLKLCNIKASLCDITVSVVRCHPTPFYLAHGAFRGT